MIESLSIPIVTEVTRPDGQTEIVWLSGVKYDNDNAYFDYRRKSDRPLAASNDNDGDTDWAGMLFGDRLTCSIAEARKALGVGKHTVYKYIEDGKLTKGKLRGRTVLRVDEVRALITGAFRA